MLGSYQVDAASGGRLIGGEMLEWSDLAVGRGSGAAGALLRATLRRGSACGRVLVLGPLASDLIDALPGGGEVDVLVRALPDARQLATLGQLRRGVTVYCGALDRFDPDRSYDLVISLDGPEVLLSPDSAGFGHQELLRRLAGWLTPGGTLLATIANDLGFDRLFRLQVRDILDADDMWHRAASDFDGRPLYHRELRSVLAAANLEPDTVFAVFPAAGSLSMLVGLESIEDPVVGLTAAALAARAEVASFADQPALVDPYDLALRVFESGLSHELSPAWLVVARLAGAPNGSAGQPVAVLPELPALLATEETGRAQWRALTTIERRDERWVHRLDPVAGAAEMRERNVVRDFRRLEAVQPKGMLTLEAVLRRACAAGDISRVRELVQNYRRWLLDTDAWPPGDADARFFAVPANVVVAGDNLQSFERTWQFTAPMPDEVLLVRGLRDFAGRLLRSGAEHPWAPDISPDALTQTLASMAGVHWSAPYVDTVARAEAELDVVVGGGDATAEALAYALNLQRGASQFVSHAGPSRGYREALATSSRMAQALEERQGQVEWLEATLRARDRRVGALEKQISSISSSMSFRIGRFFTWPLRASVSGVRRVMLSAIPPGYLTRAKDLLRRVVRRMDPS